MITGSLARRYARALMQIGSEQGNYEQLGAELRSLGQAYRSSKELETALTNPAFPRAERERILVALLERLGASPIVVNVTRLLLERERAGAIPDISRELDAMIDEKIGRVAAVITSATPLSGQQQAAVIAALEKLSGRTVSAETRHDPELLGGVVAQVGDVVYDGSLRTQLHQMRHRLGAH
jgi:F-type H+-transporting ATPase subunit delta